MCFSMIQRLSDLFKKLSMQRKIIVIALIALLILLSPRLYQGVVELYRSTECSISGGKWTVGGLAQVSFCLRTFPDAGKACQSSDECMGGCVLYDITGQPVCKTNNDPFECYALIEYPHLFGCAD